jgi:hypothetical protein
MSAANWFLLVALIATAFAMATLGRRASQGKAGPSATVAYVFAAGSVLASVVVAQRIFA